MSTALNLFEQQQKNRRQTVIWMVAFILFFAWIGFGGDLAAWLAMRDEFGTSQYRMPWIGIIVTTIGIIVTWRAFKGGPKSLLWANGAKELTNPQSTEERQVLNVVEEMAVAAGIPRPRVYLVEDADPNAFATGHGPEDACVAVTTGLIQKLNREELQAVVGHEMAHVQNLDVRLMTTIAALGGFIVLLSDGLGRFMRHGGIFGRGRGGGGRKGGGAGALAIIVLVLWLITLVLAPLIVRLMAMGVSRNREFLADATAAQLTRNPMALASALEKIESSHEPTHAIKKSAAHLCIADPLGRKLNNKQGAMANLFGTHPPMSMRITRLRGMAYQAAKITGQPA